eukprot:3774304-Rhodomonas_salina.1
MYQGSPLCGDSRPELHEVSWPARLCCASSCPMNPQVSASPCLGQEWWPRDAGLSANWPDGDRDTAFLDFYQSQEKSKELDSGANSIGPRPM